MSIRATDLLRRGAPRPALMGILNATPDSFSDGGMWNNPDSARQHVLDMIDQGAEVIDVGAESTRPGADPVSEQDEIARLIPVLDSFRGSTDVPVSVDTMKASVARKAIEHGANILNDVSGLADPGMAALAAECDVPIVLMFNYGAPKTFNTDFVSGDIFDIVSRYLRSRIEMALDAGVPEHNIILDPGVGFGTTSEQSLALTERSGVFSEGKYPLLVGPSRKRFLKDYYPGIDRDEATAEVCVKAFAGGADILRVHNVACVAKRFV